MVSALGCRGPQLRRKRLESAHYGFFDDNVQSLTFALQQLNALRARYAVFPEDCIPAGYWTTRGYAS